MPHHDLRPLAQTSPKQNSKYPAIRAILYPGFQPVTDKKPISCAAIRHSLCIQSITPNHGFLSKKKKRNGQFKP
jgi:hypothetical protein